MKIHASDPSIRVCRLRRAVWVGVERMSQILNRIRHCMVSCGPFFRTIFPICTRCKLGWVGGLKNVGCANYSAKAFVQIEGWVGGSV